MKPIDVHIHTNTNCNLNCVHCYADAASGRGKVLIDSGFEVGLIRFLCRHYQPDIHLEGGEIFLEEQLIWALSELDMPMRKNITITSNGVLRTENTDTLEVLRTISCLRISVEGHTDALHRSVRNCSLQMVLDNARYYKNMGINVVLRITLNRLNMNIMFSEVIPSLMEQGFMEFQVYEMQSAGRGKSSDICITGSLDSFFQDWFMHPQKAKIQVSLAERRLGEVRQYQTEFAHRGIQMISAGNNAGIAVGADRSVRICAWDMTSPPLVVLDENNFETIYDIIETQKTPHTCGFCTKVILKV